MYSVSRDRPLFTFSIRSTITASIPKAVRKRHHSLLPPFFPHICNTIGDDEVCQQAEKVGHLVRVSCRKIHELMRCMSAFSVNANLFTAKYNVGKEPKEGAICAGMWIVAS